jgi:ribosomal protein S18 acetylase RimI-like enzyme
MPEFEIGPTRPDEDEAILAMTVEAGVFNQKENSTVRELLDGYYEGPEISGYNFLSCRADGELLGYACYGPRDLSSNGYDLYWICASVKARNQGVGRALMRRVEEEIAQRNGVWVVIETSDTDHYQPARRLYERCGYTLAMYLPDFYGDGDGLCTYTRRLR